MWLQVEDSLNTRCEHLSFMIFCIGIFTIYTQLFEILLFCSDCFVAYNACYVLHFATAFVTAIILRYTKNIYKICNCKPHRPKANFLTNTCCNFHSNQSTTEKVIAKLQRGPDFMKHAVDCIYCVSRTLLSLHYQVELMWFSGRRLTVPYN